MRTCAEPECDREVIARSLCRRHYKHYAKMGEWPDHARRVADEPKPPCSVDGCNTISIWRSGLCAKHDARKRRHGDPLHLEGTEPGSVPVDAVEFNGITFRRYPESPQHSHRRYYKPNARHIRAGVQALHQEVWKHHNGPIPDGHHIHHHDGDSTNNDISNLELLTSEEHAAEHAEARRERGRSPEQLALLARIRPLAAEWHRSEEGRAWHRDNASKTGFGRASRLQPDDE